MHTIISYRATHTDARDCMCMIMHEWKLIGTPRQGQGSANPICVVSKTHTKHYLSYLNPSSTPFTRPFTSKLTNYHDLGTSYEMSYRILHLLLFFLHKILTYYSSIIPNSFRCLLFSKLCQHNLSRYCNSFIFWLWKQARQSDAANCIIVIILQLKRSHTDIPYMQANKWDQYQ